MISQDLKFAFWASQGSKAREVDIWRKVAGEIESENLRHQNGNTGGVVVRSALSRGH